ncbi:MAG: SigE family RNA polymerase sigma factor [Nocardioidaceae bacterium]
MLAQQPSAGWVRRERTEPTDQEADFDEFMNAQWAPLFRTAYLLTGDYQLAEDLLQTAFAKVFLSWSKIARMGQPAAYTRKIVTNQAMSWWRRRSSSEVPTIDIQGGSFAGHEDRVTQASAVWDALRSLPSRQRAVMVLRYYEDLSEAEIADTLGISTGSVKSHASAARAALAKRLGSLDHDLTNGDPE